MNDSICRTEKFINTVPIDGQLCGLDKFKVICKNDTTSTTPNVKELFTECLDSKVCKQSQRKEQFQVTSVSTWEQSPNKSLTKTYLDPSFEYTIIEECPKTTLLELLGQIGGYLGLLVGISVITLFEILELIIIATFTFL
jgi:hypothetical protein